MSRKEPEGGRRHLVEYGGQEIEFALFYSDKKTLSITVDPESKVRVIAPAGKPLDHILARVRRRAPWIRRQLRYFEQFKPPQPPRQYVSGETHLYLGRQYRLKVVAREESVKLKGKYLVVCTPDRQAYDRIKDLVQDWYRDHARAIFEKRLEICFKVARKYSIPYPRLKFRRIGKRWGSCSKSGDILLNTELVKAPLYCIEYVIMHELCHLKVRPHGPEFYRLLSRCMPDWERRKQKLEAIIL